MRILFLTPRSPTAPDSGGLQVTLERIRELARVAEVTVAHLVEERPPREPLLGVAELVGAGRLRPRTARGLIASWAHRLPLSVWRNSDPVFVGRVAELRGGGWDLVYVDHWLVWQAARGLRGLRTILHLHNSEPEIFRRAAGQLHGVHRALAIAEYHRSARFLRRAVTEVEELHLLSPADKETLADSGIGHPRTRVFLPAASRPLAEPAPFHARMPSALFVGSLSWPPNAEGLRWYLEHAWALRRTAATLDVAGGGAPTALAALASATPGVRAHGFVDDLEPLYASARCLVAPLLSGSGIKIKIINALARGLPVVTTRVGCEGMPERGGEALFVADGPADFASKVDRLMTDADGWARASKHAREYMRRHFSGDDFVRWCSELAAHALHQQAR